jgi:N-acetylmuramoyl-L-alanine amidase
VAVYVLVCCVYWTEFPGGTIVKRLIVLTLLLCAPVPFSAIQALAQAHKTVYRVSIAARADGQGYVVRLHSNGKVRSDDLRVDQDDLRYAEISLSDARVADDLMRGEAEGPIRGFSVVEVDGSVVTRLSLDPSQPVQIVAYPDRDSEDGLIALTYANVTPASPRRVEPRSAEKSVKFASLDIEPLAPVSAEESVAGRAWRLDCVVIDPGHGGKDPGAVAHGVREKDVNLAVAKKLGHYIEDRLGLRVIYTRTDDRFVPLKERGRIANDDCGKLFISLHVNSARRRSASGTEIYFLGLHKTDAAKEVMERENSVIRLENDPEQYVDLGSDQAIMETLAQSVYMRESEHLADLVHLQFRDRAQRPVRGVKQAGFLVLWKASMPAILVELGFVTNKQEARYLKSSSGHDLLASAIFRAVRSYRDAYERGFDWASAE